MTHELKTGGDRGYLRIATEEAFATQEQIDGYLRLVREGKADRGTTSLWGFYASSPSERTTLIRERLQEEIRGDGERGIERERELVLACSDGEIERATERLVQIQGQDLDAVERERGGGLTEAEAGHHEGLLEVREICGRGQPAQLDL